MGLLASREPQLDFALVPKAKRPRPHPKQALLLIEVAKTWLRLDQKVKAPLYAEGGSPEYWIVHVETGQLEVFRHPKAGQGREHFFLGRADAIRPLSFPKVELPLKAFLLAAPRH